MRQLQAETLHLCANLAPGRLAEGRLLFRSLVSAALMFGLCLALALLPDYQFSLMAERFFHPKRNLPKPSFLRLEVRASAPQIGRGGEVIIQAKIHGEMPLSFRWLYRGASSPQRCWIALAADAGATAAPPDNALEMARSQRRLFVWARGDLRDSLRYRVRCGDAETEERVIAVVVQPEISELRGHLEDDLGLQEAAFRFRTNASEKPDTPWREIPIDLGQEPGCQAPLQTTFDLDQTGTAPGDTIEVQVRARDTAGGDGLSRPVLIRVVAFTRGEDERRRIAALTFLQQALSHLGAKADGDASEHDFPPPAEIAAAAQISLQLRRALPALPALLSAEQTAHAKLAEWETRRREALLAGPAAGGAASAFFRAAQAHAADSELLLAIEPWAGGWKLVSALGLEMLAAQALASPPPTAGAWRQAAEPWLAPPLAELETARAEEEGWRALCLWREWEEARDMTAISPAEKALIARILALEDDLTAGVSTAAELTAASDKGENAADAARKFLVESPEATNDYLASQAPSLATAKCFWSFPIFWQLASACIGKSPRAAMKPKAALPGTVARRVLMKMPAAWTPISWPNGFDCWPKLRAPWRQTVSCGACTAISMP